MIFLLLFLIIVIIVIFLNIHDNANLEKIKKHFKNSKCENIIYSKGKYKGICEDKVMQIENSFSVNLIQDENNIKFNKIKKINKNVLRIIINDNYKIEFKDKNNVELYYKKIKGIKK